MTADSPTERRRRCLAAVPAIVERLNPATMREDEVAAAAGLTPEELVAEFGSLAGFCEAVQLDFFEQRLAYVIDQVDKMSVGLGRIHSAWTAYMDFALAHAAVYTWCEKARAQFPAMHEQHRARQFGVVTMLKIELTALRWAHPTESAQLVLAMVLEVVRTETESRRQHAVMRKALWTCLDTLSKLE